MLGGISVWQLAIVLGIVILIFGTKKLRNMGGDLGGAVKGFKKAMSDDDKPKQIEQEEKDASFEKSEAKEESKDKDKV